MFDDELRRLATRVRAFLEEPRRLLFITGAGLSAESGLPTYRGIGGLYESSGTEHGIPVEVALSGPMFRRQPHITWQHIAQLERAVRGAKPNAAHTMIAELEKNHEVVVLTQNVDGFHHRAGSTRVIDIHGDCHRLACTGCDHRELREDYEGLEIPPLCPRCQSVIRPEVVLFEEMLPSDKLVELARELRQGFDAYFSIGTTSVFPYIAQPMLDARRAGRLSIEINPGETEVSELVELKFRCGAVRALQAILEADRG